MCYMRCLGLTRAPSRHILPARYVKPREIILVRFQSLAEFHIPVPTDVIREDPPMILQFIAIVTLTELSRPFSGIRGEGRAILFLLRSRAFL